MPTKSKEEWQPPTGLGHTVILLVTYHEALSLQAIAVALEGIGVKATEKALRTSIFTLVDRGNIEVVPAQDISPTQYKATSSGQAVVATFALAIDEATKGSIYRMLEGMA